VLFVLLDVTRERDVVDERAITLRDARSHVSNVPVELVRDDLESHFELPERELAGLRPFALHKPPQLFGNAPNCTGAIRTAAKTEADSC
jgi:hypothetical protein